MPPQSCAPCASRTHRRRRRAVAESRAQGSVRAGRDAAAQRPPRERLQFKALLAGNPNYFGNFPEAGLKAVQVIAGNTSYEQVTCVGYNLNLSLLEATVQIKRPGGYGGSLCFKGSTEFVRFYVDYGSGWQDA